jgi:hypothetical protein
MPLVARQQVVGARGVRAVNKFIIGGVFRHQERTRRGHGMRMAPYELEKLMPETLANLKLGARENLDVFSENCLEDV